ncbi:MAG: universal stress protein [Anaerolineaceae bacterium]|nr:MAG: universal stress protein [Anaerolineaceae bacterium]
MSFKRILVPLDGSQLAERALIPALAFAEMMLAKVFVFRIAIPLSLNLDPKLYQRIIELRQNEANCYLRSIQSRFSSSPAEIETYVAVGRGTRPIINFVKENEIDLIFMTSHGDYGVNRWIYGSVAHRVLHHAPCAKVIIYPQMIIEPFSITHILVPLDGSLLAEQALRPAIALAEAMSAELTLLGVMKSQLFEQWATFRSRHDDFVESEELELNDYLQRVKVSVTDSPVTVSTWINTGVVTESINEFANDHQVDLIVMCNHGYFGIKRWVFGSVIDNVLRGANGITLVIHHQEA